MTWKRSKRAAEGEINERRGVSAPVRRAIGAASSFIYDQRGLGLNGVAGERPRLCGAHRFG